MFIRAYNAWIDCNRDAMREKYPRVQSKADPLLQDEFAQEWFHTALTPAEWLNYFDVDEKELKSFESREDLNLASVLDVPPVKPTFVKPLPPPNDAAYREARDELVRKNEGLRFVLSLARPPLCHVRALLQDAHSDDIRVERLLRAFHQTPPGGPTPSSARVDPKNDALWARVEEKLSADEKRTAGVVYAKPTVRETSASSATAT